MEGELVVHDPPGACITYHYIKKLSTNYDQFTLISFIIIDGQIN